MIAENGATVAAVVHELGKVLARVLHATHQVLRTRSRYQHAAQILRAHVDAIGDTDAMIVEQLEGTLEKVWLVSANKLASVLRAATSVECERMDVDEFTRMTNAVSVLVDLID